MSKKYILTSEFPPKQGSHTLRVSKLFNKGFVKLEFDNYVIFEKNFFSKFLNDNICALLQPKHYSYKINPININKLINTLKLGDQLYTSSGCYFAHIIGSIVKQARPDIVWVADFGDPWSAGELFPENLPTRRIISYLEENKYLRFADHIFVTTKHYQKFLEKKYNNVHYIPMGFSNVDVKKMNSDFILYGGSSYSLSRNLKNLINAVKDINSDLLIVGDVSSKYQKYINNKNILNVKIKGRLSYEDFSEFELSSSVQVVILNKCFMQIPGKLYQCIANKPTLVISQGYLTKEISEICSMSDSTIIVCNSVDDIKNGLLKLVDFKNSSVSKEFCEIFSWLSLANKVRGVVK